MDFSIQIVKEALVQNGVKENMVSSPLSIAAMLNILAFGSSGRTREQLLEVLGSQTLADAESNYSKLAAASSGVADSGEGEGPLLNFVNGAWVNQLYAIKPSFERSLRSIFKAETKSLDFENKVDESIDEINSWVKRATNGLIDKIVKSNLVRYETTIILANALYFKGKWEVKFNPSLTEDRYFYTANGEKVLAPFMHVDGRNRYCYNSFDTFTVAKLPYKNGGADDGRQFSLNLFLPNERDGLPMLLKEFSENPSLFLSEKLAVSRVGLDEFLVPKFKFTYEFNVSELISGLDLNINELTEMVEDLDGNTAKYVGAAMLQKARIIVDEEGTEAAAVTCFEVLRCCRSPPKRPSFVADHPFMFMIREDNTGTPFFTGVVVNPLAG